MIVNLSRGTGYLAQDGTDQDIIARVVRGEPDRPRVLVDDEEAAGLADAREDRLAVPRDEGSQVENLDTAGAILRRVEASMDHLSPGDDRDGVPSHSLGRPAERQDEVVAGVRAARPRGVEEGPVLEEESRILPAERTAEEADRVLGVAREGDPPTGHVGEGRLAAHAVEGVPSALPEAHGDADDYPAAELPGGAPAERSEVRELLVGGVGVLAELDLRDGEEPGERHPGGASDDPFLGEGGIEDAPRAEAPLQVPRRAVHPSLRADVLPEDDHPWIPLQLDRERGADRVDEVDARPIARRCAPGGRIACHDGSERGLLGALDIYAKFPEITLSTGEKQTMSYGQYRAVLATNYNQADRRQAFLAHYGTYAANLNTYASLYHSVCQRDWFQARARGYASSLEAALHGNAIPTSVVENLIATTRNGTAPLRRYHKLRRTLLKLDRYYPYDFTIPIIQWDARYDYQTMLHAIVDAVAPLGPDYQARMTRGFSERWIDVYENDGKRSGLQLGSRRGTSTRLNVSGNSTELTLSTAIVRRTGCSCGRTASPWKSATS